MSSLNLEQLRTLVAVVDHGTFDAAAAALNVSAPAISQRIRALEDSTGRVLVRRDKPVLPTAAGETLLRTARQMLHLEQALAVEMSAGADVLDDDRERDGHDEADAPVMTVPVAVNSDSLSGWFLRSLVAAELGPRVLFDIRREDEAHSTELLRSGEVMAAVTSEKAAVQGCRVVSLGAMRYRACASPAVAARAGLDDELPAAQRRRMLRRIPRIDFDARDAMQRTFYRRLTGENPDTPSHAIPSTAEYHKAIRLGLGWGLFPEQMAQKYLDSGELVDIAPDLRHEVPLYWQHWRIRSPILDRLTAAVQATAREALVQG